MRVRISKMTISCLIDACFQMRSTPLSSQKAFTPRKTSKSKKQYSKPKSTLQKPGYKELSCSRVKKVKKLTETSPRKFHAHHCNVQINRWRRWITKFGCFVASLITCTLKMTSRQSWKGIRKLTSCLKATIILSSWDVTSFHKRCKRCSCEKRSTKIIKTRCEH